MRTMATLLALAGLASLANAEDKKYTLTGENTKIEWTGTKKDGKHDGGFKKVTGSATAGEAIAFDLTIDVTSLYSDDEKLTGHLKGPDFFNVTDNPKAKFASKKVAKDAKGYTVTGDLTLLGKSKGINFPAEISTDGGLKVKAEFKIDRFDYGMTFGEGKVDKEVAIRVKIEAK